MAGEDGSLVGIGAGDLPGAQPRQEVIVRTVREVSGANWLVLTRTNW
jgi:hypothetical protein